MNRPILTVAAAEEVSCFYRDNGRWTGYCFDSLLRIQDKLDFDIEIITNSNWTYDNMIEEIANGAADLSFNRFYIMPERQKLVDFLMPVNAVRMTAILKMVKARSEYFSFIGPFHWSLWLAVAVTFFVFSFSLVFSANLVNFTPQVRRIKTKLRKTLRRKQEPEINNYTVKEGLWVSYGALMMQGGGETPKTAGGIILLVGWWLFCLIVVSTYTANLAAFLTKDIFLKPVQTIKQLIGQDKLTYGVYSVFSGDVQFWKNYQQKEDLAITYKLYETREEIDRVLLGGSGAWITDETGLHDLRKNYCDVKLYVLEDFFNRMLIAFPINKTAVNQKFKNAGKNVTVNHINELLLEQLRIGVMQELENKYAVPCHGEGEEEMRQLKFQDLSGLFMIFGVVVFLGIFSSFIQVINTQLRGNSPENSGKIKENGDPESKNNNRNGILNTNFVEEPLESISNIRLNRVRRFSNTN